MGDSRHTVDATASEVPTATDVLQVPTLELVCGECGYGIVVRGTAPECPMCRQRVWDSPVWRPFMRPSVLPPKAVSTAPPRAPIGTATRSSASLGEGPVRQH